jgi:hypothetical protein
MIRHTVAFSLARGPASIEEASFLEATLVLETIPGVQKFEQLRQVSPKSVFASGF